MFARATRSRSCSHSFSPSGGITFFCSAKKRDPWRGSYGLLPSLRRDHARAMLGRDPWRGSCNHGSVPMRIAHWVFVFKPSSHMQAWLGWLKNKNPAVNCGTDTWLRREGDSNPRYSYPYGSLANCWFKPLTHLS